MEILLVLIIAFVAYCIFKGGNVYRKSEAATIVQKLLEPVHQFGMFEGRPAEAARQYVEDVSDKDPHALEDASGKRPDAIALAAYALALAAKSLFERKDNNAYPVSIALGKALSGIQQYGHALKEERLNARLITSAEQIYLTVVRPQIREDSPAMQQLTANGTTNAPLRSVESNPAEGVFQMLEFPYVSYEAWLDAYRKAASDTTEALKIQKRDDGKDWSLIDLMDDAPLRSAFEHHLDPVPLGTYFGKVFNIEEMMPAARR